MANTAVVDESTLSLSMRMVDRVEHRRNWLTIWSCRSCHDTNFPFQGNWTSQNRSSGRTIDFNNEMRSETNRIHGILKLNITPSILSDINISGTDHELAPSAPAPAPAPASAQNQSSLLLESWELWFVVALFILVHCKVFVFKKSRLEIQGNAGSDSVLHTNDFHEPMKINGRDNFEVTNCTDREAIFAHDCSTASLLEISSSDANPDLNADSQYDSPISNFGSPFVAFEDIYLVRHDMSPISNPLDSLSQLSHHVHDANTSWIAQPDFVSSSKFACDQGEISSDYPSVSTILCNEEGLNQLSSTYITAPHEPLGKRLQRLFAIARPNDVKLSLLAQTAAKE